MNEKQRAHESCTPESRKPAPAARRGRFSGMRGPRSGFGLPVARKTDHEVREDVVERDKVALVEVDGGMLVRGLKARAHEEVACAAALALHAANHQSGVVGAVERHRGTDLAHMARAAGADGDHLHAAVDGHDVVGLVEVLKNLRRLNCPCVLHVATQKGKGYEPAEMDPTAYHGVGVFDPLLGLPEKKPGRPTYTEVFGRWLCDTAAADKRLYGITPAMREGSGLVEFARRYPERYRDVAIAEQHAVTYAAGLACEGIKPGVAIYSTFLQRAIDQVIHDVALQNLPVVFAIDRGGLVGADGATHHGFFDISLLRTIPNMTVMTPSDENECRLMLNTAYSMNTPASVRYPRGRGPGVEVTAGGGTIPVGRSRTLRKGSRVAFLGFGSMTNVLAPVAEKLDGTLIDMRFVKPIDEEAVLEAARTHDMIVCAEEGMLMGGACNAVLEVLADNGAVRPVMRFGLPDEFIEQGTQAELLEDVGLTSEAIESKVAERIAKLGI